MKGETIRFLTTDALKHLAQAAHYVVHAKGCYGRQDVMLLDSSIGELRFRGVGVEQNTELVFTDPD